MAWSVFWRVSRNRLEALDPGHHHGIRNPPFLALAHPGTSIPLGPASKRTMYNKLGFPKWVLEFVGGHRQATAAYHDLHPARGGQDARPRPSARNRPERKEERAGGDSSFVQRCGNSNGLPRDLLGGVLKVLLRLGVGSSEARPRVCVRACLCTWLRCARVCSPTCGADSGHGYFPC